MPSFFKLGLATLATIASHAVADTIGPINIGPYQGITKRNNAAYTDIVVQGFHRMPGSKPSHGEHMGAHIFENGHGLLECCCRVRSNHQCCTASVNGMKLFLGDGRVDKVDGELSELSTQSTGVEWRRRAGVNDDRAYSPISSLHGLHSHMRHAWLQV